MPDAGLYVFPGQLDDDMATLREKYARGPVGLLAYRPGGGEVLSPAQLVRQLILDIFCAAVFAFLVVKLGVDLPTSVQFGALLGLFSMLAISVPQWNWYGFPLAFTLAEGLDQVVGWSLGGAAIGWWANRS